MYQTGHTINKTLDDIHRHDLVLPAIQREFVWQPDQIHRLFDSLMQGYPFGTFLYWRVDPENSSKFKFFDFVLNYHERDKPHCPPLPEMPNRQLTAVLDGQQRLTALNIGLRGTMARKLPRLWRNNPNAFPEQKLHLDLLWAPDEDEEEGLRYRFRFLTAEQTDVDRDGECWFRVGQVLSMPDAGPAMTGWLTARLPQDKVTPAHQVLYRLYQVVHSEHLVAYYEEKSQELDKALQIFIRMNDGGTQLSHSDLLLSIAVAQWTHYDAREEIHSLVDELNRIGAGFSFSKDLVLKAGLMLSGIGRVGFRVDNFNRANMTKFENSWDQVRDALTLTVQLVSSFGFNGQNLTAHNAILPIAYYLHEKDPGDSYLTHSRFQHDRRIVRDWLIQSLLKSGVWGSGLDTLLTSLREAIRRGGSDSFPDSLIREAMSRRGKSLVFDDEEIEELADMKYKDRLTFALLSLLFPFVDLRNQFHIDHIFPSARFKDRRLREADVAGDEIANFQIQKDQLANLQLLEGVANSEKNAKMPADWLHEVITDPVERRAYHEKHLLGHIPDSMADFGSYCDARRERLKNRITELLGR